MENTYNQQESVQFSDNKPPISLVYNHIAPHQQQQHDEPDLKEELINFLKYEEAQAQQIQSEAINERIRESQEQFKNDLSVALRELDLSAGEEQVKYELSHIKLSPVTIGICVGGILFGSGLILNTTLNRRLMTRSSRMTKYAFGFGLIAFNMVHLARSQLLQKPPKISDQRLGTDNAIEISQQNQGSIEIPTQTINEKMV
eukprot:403335688